MVTNGMLRQSMFVTRLYTDQQLQQVDGLPAAVNPRQMADLQEKYTAVK